MDPLTIFGIVSNLIPEALHLLGHDTAAKTAEKVTGLVQAVTGKSNPDEAVAALQGSPDLILQLKSKIIDETIQLAQIKAKADADDAAADTASDEALTKRISLYEGTAGDLKAIPYLGPFMLFMRGMQRLVISYGTVYADYLWLTGGMGTLPDLQQRLLFTASMLVFVVLFGERAIKNVAPFVVDILNARK